MTGAELLREGGWRMGHNPDGTPYWEHDAFRLVRYAPECALAQALELAHAELSHDRPAIAALHEGANKLREELRGEREKYRQVVEINNANERAYLAKTDALRAELGPVILACDAIPDITLSKWACDPGAHWNRVREALRARRAAQGLDVDAADPENAFDEHGWLKQRKAGR